MVPTLSERIALSEFALSPRWQRGTPSARLPRPPGEFAVCDTGGLHKPLTHSREEIAMMTATGLLNQAFVYAELTMN